MNTKDPVEMIHHVLKNKGTPKIKLIGDSITHNWTGWSDAEDLAAAGIGIHIRIFHDVARGFDQIVDLLGGEIKYVD